VADRVLVSRHRRALAGQRHREAAEDCQLAEQLRAVQAAGAQGRGPLGREELLADIAHDLEGGRGVAGEAELRRQVPVTERDRDHRQVPDAAEGVRRRRFPQGALVQHQRVGQPRGPGPLDPVLGDRGHARAEGDHRVRRLEHDQPQVSAVPLLLEVAGVLGNVAELARAQRDDRPARGQAPADLVDLGEVRLHPAVLVAQLQHLDLEPGRRHQLGDQGLEAGAVSGERPPILGDQDRGDPVGSSSSRMAGRT